MYVNANRREILTNFGDRAVPRSSIFGGFRTTWNRIIVSHRFPSHTARALAPGFDVGLSNNSIHLPFQYRTRMTYSCTKPTSGVQSSVDMSSSCWLFPRRIYIPPRIFYARAQLTVLGSRYDSDTSIPAPTVYRAFALCCLVRG